MDMEREAIADDVVAEGPLEADEPTVVADETVVFSFPSIPLVELTVDDDAWLTAPLPPREPFAAVPSFHADAESWRKKLQESKQRLDSLNDYQYRRARDMLFPLAHSGSTVDFLANRAGHKLDETMFAAEMWAGLFGYRKSGASPSQAPLRAAVPQHSKRPREEDDGGDDDDDDGQTADALPHPRNDPPKPRKKQPVVFVDVCGGPGSFSQLVYATCRRRKWPAMGFGMTLLDSHNGAPDGWYPELMERNRFVATFGIDGTGNIYRPSNVDALRSIVEPFGPRLVVGDGGFEVDRTVMHLQESITARIVFSQWYAAVTMLRNGGMLVLKLFDVFTQPLCDLIILSCIFFDSVVIVKPQHSRVVNSERYLAAKGFRVERGLCPGSRWRALLDKVYEGGFDDEGVIASILPPVFRARHAEVLETLSVTHLRAVATVSERQCTAIDMVTRFIERGGVPLRHPWRPTPPTRERHDGAAVGDGVAEPARDIAGGPRRASPEPPQGDDAELGDGEIAETC